jgi:hypothetical protein
MELPIYIEQTLLMNFPHKCDRKSTNVTGGEHYSKPWLSVKRLCCVCCVLGKLTISLYALTFLFACLIHLSNKNSASIVHVVLASYGKSITISWHPYCFFACVDTRAHKLARKFKQHTGHSTTT